MSFQPPSLTALISSYPILTTLSSLVSSVDLLNLALTNHTHHDCIMASPPIFSSLLRSTLCTGSGILDRQTSHDRMRTYKWSRLAQPNERDEPIEVHLYALKCDTADTLPCCKCGINVCEECRHRLEPGVWGGPWPIPWWHHRRPHLNVSWELDSIVCLCPRCDAKAEDEVRGKFLSELCDCDELRRWICRKCKRGERKAWLDYRKDHTIMEAHFDQTMSLPDHQHERWMWCTCGNDVPEGTRPRCSACMRRHRPRDEWYKEWRSLKSTLQPMLDPDYPYWIFDEEGKYPTPYPQLGYSKS